MDTQPFNASLLSESVFAVPPMARDANGVVDKAENEKIVRFLEDGGIRSILYGGNAVFYHIQLSEYADTLTMLAEIAGDSTTIVPSIGPAYGLAMDQVDILKEHQYATAMLLPSRDIVDQNGIARAVRQLAERFEKPLVLYLKIDRWLDPELIRSLHADGLISWIKYAVVRDDPSDDDYLREVLDVFPAERTISGIGEQPAIVHLRDFGVIGFTSGCVCVAPDRSMQMMRSIQSGDYELAEKIRKWFLPLEDLRNDISPIRVLHHAVEEAGIAKTGNIMPMLSSLTKEQIAKIGEAVRVMKTSASEVLPAIGFPDGPELNDRFSASASCIIQSAPIRFGLLAGHATFLALRILTMSHFLTRSFVVVALIGMCSLSFAADKTTTSKTKTTSSKKAAAKTEVKGRLPRYFASIVDEKQRTEIYTIQSEYRAKIEALEKELAKLRAAELDSIEDVLTSTQKRKLTSLRSSKSTKSKSSTSKSTAAKTASSKSTSSSQSKSKK